MIILKTRDVVIAKFPQSDPQGHEQEGIRPAVVVGFPSSIGTPRFDLVMITPMTTAKQQSWAVKNTKLYPVLEAGAGGLPNPSVILLDQTRFLDITRIGRQLGQLTIEEYAPILEGLQSMLEID